MSDWSKSAPSAESAPLFISTAGQFSPTVAMQVASATAPTGAARTWVAKLVSYCPMAIPYRYPVNRVWWVNGSTNTTTNVDFGIYTADGTRIYNTGSTVMGTVSTVQYVTPGTTFALDPGLYYFAWSCDNTTSRGYALAGTANGSRLSGLLEETTGSFGLPATMTPVAFARAWGPSVCGVTRTTTGF